MTEKEDFGERLRNLFPEGMVMELEPLLKALESEGEIHDVSCEEAIKGSLSELRNKETNESFSEVWNSVHHIETCERRACRELRTPIFITKYMYPTENGYVEIENKVKVAFIADKVRDGLDKEEAEKVFNTLLPDNESRISS